MFHEISSNPPSFGPLASSIDHGRCFCCVNGALWSMCFHRTGIDGLNGCWSTPSAK